MAMKALLEGTAGTYRLRGGVWELGSFAYRAYLRVVPAGRGVMRGNPVVSVVSADGMNLQEVLGAAKGQVETTTGARVEKLDVLHTTTPSPGGDTEIPALLRSIPRRYPRPSD